MAWVAISFSIGWGEEGKAKGRLGIWLEIPLGSVIEEPGGTDRGI